ncbi:Molecular chaperone DnaK (HSP70) [Ruminococcaceae bacterium YRB3002]|nr:Molecular chaperone DnaK (HSP70) [Ruminococcaceae bacterium YRB3002]
MAKVYGIDLGTTYSVITTLDDNGMPEVIANQDEGSDLLASAVYFQEGADPVVGEVAKNQKDIEPDRVVEFVKRYIGKPDAPTYEFDGVKYDPITISSLILKRLKAYADAQGHDVQNVVITCPAYFGGVEKAATEQAGIIAGLNVLNIVHEPTAAAINYCIREYKENRKIMVYDLGGGTFDVTLFDFSVDDSGKANIDVIKIGGDDRLGGIDWDARMFDYMCSKYAYENGTEVSDMDDELRATIRAQVEQAKRDLSTLEKKSYTIKYDGDRTRIELTRQEFEERTQDLVERTMSFVNKLLVDCNYTPDNVDVVLLVGGSTFMPMIKNAVEALFPGKVRVEQPNLAVAKGAALAAALEWNERILNGENPIPDGKPGLAGEVNVDPADPDAGMINVPGHIGVISDKLSRSLGPAVFVSDDSYMIDNLLFVGDTIPAEAESIYGTRTDNQPEIVVHVYENVSEDRVNKHLIPCFDEKGDPQYTDPDLKVKHIGEVHLELPPNTPKDSPIRVVFRSSTTGLEVTATNVTTGESAKTVIRSESLYSEEDIEKAKTVMEGIQTSGQI